MSKECSKIIEDLTSGQCRISMNDKGCKFEMPPEFDKGFGTLMKMIEQEPGLDMEKCAYDLNVFFLYCKRDIHAVHLDNKAGSGIGFSGKDAPKLLEFFKYLCG